MAKMKTKDIGGGSDVAPLPVRVYKNVPLSGVYAFRQVNKFTGKERTMFSLYWNSGHPMQDTDGNIIVDDNNQQRPHYFNDGFVTLSFDQRSNMYPILRALGFRGSKFMDDEGNFLDDLDIDIEFGKSGKGEDYSGCDLDELPVYNGGPKKDVEVEVTKFTINGVSVLGRVANLDIDVKDNWNRIAQYMPADDPIPMKAGAAAEVQVAETPAPAAGGQPLTDKERTALIKQLGKAGVENPEAQLNAISLHTVGIPADQLTGGKKGSAFIIFTLAKDVEQQSADPVGSLLPPSDEQLDDSSPFGEPDDEEAAFA